jgi:hypothetical protein
MIIYIYVYTHVQTVYAQYILEHNDHSFCFDM